MLNTDFKLRIFKLFFPKVGIIHEKLYDNILNDIQKTLNKLIRYDNSEFALNILEHIYPTCNSYSENLDTILDKLDDLYNKLIEMDITVTVSSKDGSFESTYKI